MPGHRAVFAFAISIAACAPIDSDRDLAQPLVGTRVRIVAGNLVSGSGTYDDGPGVRIFQGVHPDIALIQELRVGANTPADVRSFVDTAFGAEFHVARGTSSGIPNGVVSRFPILASGDWDDPLVDNRAFTFARIDIPGPTDLWAVSVHLLTSSATNRDNEAEALVAAIADHVPEDDWVVIGGDLNTRSRGEAAISRLSSKVVTSGPFPADGNGDGDTNEPRSRPYDWILPSPGLADHTTATVIGASSFPDGLVVDTRRYTPLAEIAPAQSGDSGASGMQHMAVVRDFDVPGGAGEVADVIINEILANEPGTDARAEFVEVVNRGTATADLSGWTLADAALVRHRFATGTSLAAGARLVVLAGSPILFGLPNAVYATTGALGLTNGGDTVTLADSGGTTVDAITYSAALGSVDGVSMNRSPDATAGPMVLHTTLSAQPSSAGRTP